MHNFLRNDHYFGSIKFLKEAYGFGYGRNRDCRKDYRLEPVKKENSQGYVNDSPAI